MEMFSVANFNTYQHYKDRNPPWIKFHYQILDNYEYAALPDHAKAHLNGIWLLASRHNNRLPFDAEWVARRINATCPVDLEHLASAGFILRDGNASAALAPRKQSALVETETETETEKNPPKSPKGEIDGFSDWYAVYPRKEGRRGAAKAYAAARKRATAEQLLAGAKRYAAGREGEDAKFTKQPATWLNQDCWLDDPPPLNGGKPSAGDAEHNRWQGRLARYKPGGFWLGDWGPRPESGQCACPASILADWRQRQPGQASG